MSHLHLRLKWSTQSYTNEGDKWHVSFQITPYPNSLQRFGFGLD